MTTSMENSIGVAAGDDRERRASLGAGAPHGTRDRGLATDATVMRVAVDASQGHSSARDRPLTEHDPVSTMGVASV